MVETLKKIIPLFKNKNILVIGDIMLDEHIWSKISRISPEAPVPIADVSRISHVPGGAGNVALNIKSLGGNPLLIGIIGDDSSGIKLTHILKENHLSTKYIIKDKQKPTILKSRIIAVSQQVIRVDREDRSLVSTATSNKIKSLIKKMIPKSDAIILSDYGKGILTPEIIKLAISLAKKYKKPIAVDPKGSEYKKYKGATVITPNQLEAEIAAGIKITDKKSLYRVADKIKKTITPSSLLITRGKNGMSLFKPKSKEIYIPVIPKEVFDVTGAGDTVIATLSLALASGGNLSQAAVLANYAASVVIGKVGTMPIAIDELYDALEGKFSSDKKIKSRIKIADIVKNLRLEGYRIVFTNGCFDILHLGHIRYLKEAKKLGDVLIVGLNSDSSIKTLKGPKRPYVNEHERAETLAAVECIDYIVLFPEKRPHELIKLIQPDVHVKGGDYKVKDLPEASIIKSYGGKIVIIPKIEGRSTTSLIDRIKGEK